MNEQNRMVELAGMLTEAKVKQSATKQEVAMALKILSRATKNMQKLMQDIDVERKSPLFTVAEGALLILQKGDMERKDATYMLENLKRIMSNFTKVENALSGMWTALYEFEGTGYEQGSNGYPIPPEK